MGQRAAAEATRKYFGLKTFAHTTLGRAMKKIITKLNEAETGESPESPEKAQPNQETTTKESEKPDKRKRFPEVTDTKEQRLQIMKFIGGRMNPEMEKRTYIESSHKLAWEWWETKKRLLL
jgi:hypothetical protein